MPGDESPLRMLRVIGLLGLAVSFLSLFVPVVGLAVTVATGVFGASLLIRPEWFE